MKLASLPQRRDGRLVVVSDDLAWYADADHLAPTLQQALDDWDRCAPLLESLAIELAHEAIPRKRFHEREAAAPLPRAYQRLDGAAYLNHVALVGRADGAAAPPGPASDPLLHQGGSDDLRAGRSPIDLADEAWGGDFAAGLCVVTGDVPQGVGAAEALGCIRLIGLVNDLSLRRLAPDALASGFGCVQAKPATAFSPVLVTPDALGDAWRDGQVALPLRVELNGQPFGCVEAGDDCSFGFGELIAHAATTRRLGAGTIIGSGTVSNRGEGGGPGLPVAAGGRGFACLAEQRAVERLTTGAASTPLLRWGDTVRIELRDRRGRSVCGAIDQQVVRG